MEEIIVANLTLDTYQRNKVAPLVVPQGDYGARVIRAKITDLGKPVTVESTAAVSIVATRSGDGESQAFSGSVNADGTVTVPVTQWMLDVPEEDVTCHIVVTGIGYQYSTTSFLIEPQSKANPTEIAPDDPRQDLVTEVLAGENTRRAAEAERVSNENARIAAENARQSAETQRLTDESTRITNEAQRVSAEASRDATFKSWAQDIASLPTFDGRINAIRKRVENIESGIPAESFIIDDSVAYTKDVPENVAPNAVVQKVGGMTRKCANLIPFPYVEDTKTHNGVTFTVNGDGTITASGTAVNYNATLRLANNIPLPAGTYRVTCTDTPKSGIVFVVMKNGVWHSETTNTMELLVESGDVLTLYLQVVVGASVSNFTFKPMLNEGEPKPYEPYFEGLRSAKVTEVKSVGVNMIPFPYSKTSQTISGVTFNVNGDGTIQINGTATLDIYFLLNEVEYSAGEHYCLSGCPSGGGENTYMLYDDVNYKKDFGDGITFSYPKTTTGKIYIYISSGVTVSNLTFNPMVNAGSAALPYSPYQEHTLPIPIAVQALDGYGLGVNENCYNYIAWNPEDNIKTWNKKCGVVDLGTLDWTYRPSDWYGYSLFLCVLDSIKPAGASLCALYESVNSVNEFYQKDNAIYLGNIDAPKCINIRTEAYTDAESFKAAMSGVMLVYELAEPIVTDISDLITADNLVPVQSGGTMTLVNEYSYAVPSTIIYQSR